MLDNPMNTLFYSPEPARLRFYDYEVYIYYEIRNSGPHLHIGRESIYSLSIKFDC